MFKSILYLLALMVIFLGVSIHNNDTENNVERNIYNFTESIFRWNSSLWEVEILNTTDINMEQVVTFRIHNILQKTIDLIGYSLFQGVRLGIEFGYEKAYDYDPESFISLSRLILLVVILAFIIPVIVPILAILYLFFEGLKWIINKFTGSETKKFLKSQPLFKNIRDK